MTRLTDLDKITFPVSLKNVYLEGKRPIPKLRAIVNSETNYTFAVVSENYRLITNEDAIKLGKQCFKMLFETTDTRDLEIFNIITPGTKSFCHIDVIHKKYKVNIWEQEVWLPYIRITNSYNRTRALRFDLGFCRKLCNNGVIFEKETLKVKYYHTKQQLVLSEENFGINFGKLKKLETEFLEYMKNLKRYHVPEEYALSTICKVLNINFDISTESRKKRQRQIELFNEFKDKGGRLIKEYYENMGPTAYTLLNIISDIASNPIIRMGPGSMIDTYQKRTGAWIESFIKKIEQRDFDFKNYLGEYLVLFST